MPLPMIAANWKMHKTTEETREFITRFLPLVDGVRDVEIVIAPPFTSLAVAAKLLKGSNVKLAGQDVFWEDGGAYTGEIGLVHLNEFGIDSILIGHSERRHILHETQVDVAKKFDFFAQHNFNILYCVGEPLKVKESGIDATLEYITKQFEGIDTEYAKLCVAYEPVWAIGTGLTPSLEEIRLLHGSLKEQFGVELLYGGSVKLQNAKEIMQIDTVDGVLVGSASLKVEDFASMVKIAQEINDKG